jgi:hypothetical protein
MSIETEGFPSDAPEGPTKHVVAKPFGQTEAQKLRNREEALRTLSRQECFDKGYLTVKDMDDEELRYGRMRDRNGFIPKGNQRYVQMVPREQYDAMVAEHELRYKEKIRQNLDEMLDTMIDIAKDDTVEPRDRFEAAKYLFERHGGKTAEVVQHTVEMKPWEGMLTDITGVAAISRAEHRRMREEGNSAGILDVEFEDVVPPEGVQADASDPPEPTVVEVREEGHGVSHEPPARPLVRKSGYVDADGHPTFDRDPAASAPDRATPEETPDPLDQYGTRRGDARTYADQVREAETLAARRKSSRERVQGAKKARKIARATGADAITDDITGATVGEDGKLTFE